MNIQKIVTMENEIEKFVNKYYEQQPNAVVLYGLGGGHFLVCKNNEKI